MGFVKIREICATALRQGYTWAWVGTCCIDKASGAGLSEAINPMFIGRRFTRGGTLQVLMLCNTMIRIGVSFSLNVISKENCPV
ncbi:hypothetical protein LI328DRAFT_161429 [Trichoderma asperelloides]|nr:hypothetical protein LI328DRAFT_161429 [Trichoderma asperelloides]